jgi:hypothetical protein
LKACVRLLIPARQLAEGFARVNQIAPAAAIQGDHHGIIRRADEHQIAFTILELLLQRGDANPLSAL